MGSSSTLTDWVTDRSPAWRARPDTRPQPPSAWRPLHRPLSDADGRSRPGVWGPQGTFSPLLRRAWPPRDPSVTASRPPLRPAFAARARAAAPRSVAVSAPSVPLSCAGGCRRRRSTERSGPALPMATARLRSRLELLALTVETPAAAEERPCRPLATLDTAPAIEEDSAVPRASSEPGFRA